MSEAVQPGASPAVVLLSGGLDSATVLAIAAERGFRCHALTLDYGQRHAVEIERACVLNSPAAVPHALHTPRDHDLDG